jgi:N,N'-diacetyllegionaminate synthase
VKQAILFLIPARGGSKGFPGKNLAKLADIPLVGRAARVACRAASVLGPACRVVCSTDDPAIAEAARAWEAEVPFLRPARLATDEARTMDVVFHALDTLGGVFDAVALLQPTSPLTEAEDILGAIRLHLEKRVPVISVCAAEHPVEWLYRMEEDGCLSPALPAKNAHQRQTVGVAYRPNGAIYVASPDTLRQAGSFIMGSTRGFLMPADRSVDVDSPLDLTVASAILEAQEVPCIEISGRKVGPGYPCFIIAEAGVNHNGDKALARRLVLAAAEAGADAIKFQTWVTDKLCRPGAAKAEYQKESPGADQYAMLKMLELPYGWHEELQDLARDSGLVFLSTPDEIDSARFLSGIGVPAIKVGSAELDNTPFLAQLAELGKPLILSTGMGTMREVVSAVETVWRKKRIPLALLHCVSAYPAPESEMNLRCLVTLRHAFGVPVGLSDHSQEDLAAGMGIAYGMDILEKHLTLDRTLPGPDHSMSYTPAQFRALVQCVRRAETLVGTGEKRVTESESGTRAVLRKTLYYARSLDSGTVLSVEHFVALRSDEKGLPPHRVEHLSGRSLRKGVKAGEMVGEEDSE